MKLVYALIFTIALCGLLTPAHSAVDATATIQLINRLEQADAFRGWSTKTFLERMVSASPEAVPVLDALLREIALPRAIQNREAARIKAASDVEELRAERRQRRQVEGLEPSR